MHHRWLISGSVRSWDISKSFIILVTHPEALGALFNLIKNAKIEYFMFFTSKLDVSIHFKGRYSQNTSISSNSAFEDFQNTGEHLGRYFE